MEEILLGIAKEIGIPAIKKAIDSTTFYEPKINRTGRDPVNTTEIIRQYNEQHQQPLPWSVLGNSRGSTLPNSIPTLPLKPISKHYGFHNERMSNENPVIGVYDDHMKDYLDHPSSRPLSNAVLPFNSQGFSRKR